MLLDSSACALPACGCVCEGGCQWEGLHGETSWSIFNRVRILEQEFLGHWPPQSCLKKIERNLLLDPVAATWTTLSLSFVKPWILLPHWWTSVFDHSSILNLKLVFVLWIQEVLAHGFPQKKSTLVPEVFKGQSRYWQPTCNWIPTP